VGRTPGARQDPLVNAQPGVPTHSTSPLHMPACSQGALQLTALTRDVGEDIRTDFCPSQAVPTTPLTRLSPLQVLAFFLSSFSNVDQSLTEGKHWVQRIIALVAQIRYITDTACS